MMERVREFAVLNGYEEVVYLGKWKKYAVYEPTFGNETSYTGPPLIILVKGDKIRMSTVEESYAHLQDEIEKIKIS